jgi:hypothetical protein
MLALASPVRIGVWVCGASSRKRAIRLSDAAVK